MNRLSGRIPNSVRYTNSTINIVSGNLFECPKLAIDVANSNDNEITCGSTDFNIPFYVWLSTLLLAFGVERFSINCLKSSYQWSTDRILTWLKASFNPNISNSAKSFMDKQENICSMSIVLSLFFTLVVMTSYIGLKLSGNQSNSVYKVQYLYTTTAAYFVGASPAVLIWICLTVSGLFVVVQCITTIKPDSRKVDRRISEDREDEDREGEVYFIDRLKKNCFQCVLTLFFIGVSGGINYGYLKIVFFNETENLPLFQFLFGFIKSIFSWGAPLAAKMIRKSNHNKFNIFISFIVLVLAPAFVTLVTSPLCLKDLIRKTYIPESFYYDSSKCGDKGHCWVTKIQYSSTFTPPWSYSYICSSSFLSAYLPNFAWVYIINGIFFPLIELAIMLTVSSKKCCNCCTNLLVSAGSYSGNIFYISRREETITKEVSCRGCCNACFGCSSDKLRIEVSDTVQRMCVDITLLLTFGLASPLLAILISFSMIVNTMKWKVGIGRYIEIVGEVESKESLETAFYGTSQCLPDAWWLMSLLIGLFWSFFIYDMLGDRSETAGVIGAVLMLLCCFFGLWVWKFVLDFKTGKCIIKDSCSCKCVLDFTKELRDGAIDIAKIINNFFWNYLRLQMDRTVTTSEVTVSPLNHRIQNNS